MEILKIELGIGRLVLSERECVSKSCRKACGIATLRAQPLQELYWQLGTGEDLNGDWYANQILKEFLPQYPVPSPQYPILNTQSPVNRCEKNWDLRSAL
ncbi:MAG: hypothetical protein RM368_02130 [Nostoc sp. DedSLP03]|uniref:hypothetical protein n=1 Tax=Nostoc sp. DedSLP03 TaxID=3075400 RepID=UPI002AD2CF5C|nr:hypothetical protein [Nostoc sp. DedSLP03]MDZ7963763.1 hypothetical protein [Nostoc sp. DedSLP03]